jgi:hypothetical protein
LCLTSGNADWFDWTSGVHQSYRADTDDYSGGDGKEILGVWWGRDDSYDYFRMDLAALPQIGDYADLYGVYLYSNPADGAPTSNVYVPDDPLFQGTDQIVASYFFLGSMTSTNLQDWYGLSGPGAGPLAGWYSTTLSPTGDFVHQLTSGTGYEWRLPTSALPADYAWRGTAISLGSQTAYDITDWDDTPEPGTWALLALGLPVLVWYRRRRSA